MGLKNLKQQKTKYLSQEAIERKEELKKIEILQQREKAEFAKYFITKGINTIFEQQNVFGLEQFIEQNKQDPMFELLKQIFDKSGAVATLKYINNQYLREVEGCQLLSGRSLKIKQSRSYYDRNIKLKTKSKKEVEHEADIDNQILNFVNGGLTWQRVDNKKYIFENGVLIETIVEFDIEDE